MRGIRGFTLVELMVVLAVAGVLLALSVPFGAYINNTAATSYMHEFAATLNLARSTAITAGSQVVICRLTDLTDGTGAPTGDKDCLTTNNSCGSDSASDVPWQGGWAVFLDRNGDCTITNGDNADTTTDDNNNGIPDSKENDDPIVRVYEALPNGYTLTGGKPEQVVFNSLGQTDNVTNNTWILCPPNRDVSLAKAVAVSRAGKVEFTKDGLTCP
jgi:prepilin-type N-terminal cleavage/methylation domain-containing protein